MVVFFFFNDTATTEIYTLSLHDALPILLEVGGRVGRIRVARRQRALERTLHPGAVEGLERHLEPAAGGPPLGVRRRHEAPERVVGVGARTVDGDGERGGRDGHRAGDGERLDAPPVT